MCGQPGHTCSTRPHYRLPPSFLVMDAWMISQLKVAVICVIDVFGLFFDMLPMGVCAKKALADVRSIGSGIKCLYCSE